MCWFIQILFIPFFELLYFIVPNFLSDRPYILICLLPLFLHNCQYLREFIPMFSEILLYPLIKKLQLTCIISHLYLPIVSISHHLWWRCFLVALWPHIALFPSMFDCYVVCLVLIIIVGFIGELRLFPDWLDVPHRWYFMYLFCIVARIIIKQFFGEVTLCYGFFLGVLCQVSLQYLWKCTFGANILLSVIMFY